MFILQYARNVLRHGCHPQKTVLGYSPCLVSVYGLPLFPSCNEALLIDDDDDDDDDDYYCICILIFFFLEGVL